MIFKRDIITMLVIQKRRKLSKAKPQDSDYNFICMGKFFSHRESVERVMKGDEEEIEKLADMLREKGISGFVMVQACLGGKGRKASALHQFYDWSGTGMPVVWRGVV